MVYKKKLRLRRMRRRMRVPAFSKLSRYRRYMKTPLYAKIGAPF